MRRSAVILPVLFAASLVAQTVETIPFRAVLSGDNETQQPASPTTGAATVWLHVVRDASGKVTSGSADASVNYNFTNPGTITAMHIHQGAAGADGNVVVPFTITRTEANGRGTLPTVQTPYPSNSVSLDTINAILENPGNFYFNVHSTANPAGVMRGQLQRAEAAVRMALLMPENETPPIASKSWSGTGTVMLVFTRDRSGLPNSGYVVFDVAYRGFPEGAQITGLHIHRGSAQVSGPVVIDSGLRGPVPVGAGGSGVLHYENEVDLTRAGAADALAGSVNDPQAYYLNLHTTDYPSGAMRGQLMRTDRADFSVNLSPANEVPPVTGLDTTTPGRISVFTVRGAEGTALAGAVLFDVNPAFAADTQFTGLHIHDALAGANGPVTIDSGLASSLLLGTRGAGNIYRISTVGSGQALTSLNSLLLNPQRHYVNIHTSVNRGGAMRVQLGAAAGQPNVTSVQTGIPGAAFVRLAPGSSFVITGSDLTNVTADLSGFNNLQALPVKLNGVSVTIDGVPAPLTYVAPGEIRGQVPFEVGLGNRAVVVTTPNGASNIYIANIAPQAPIILFDATGAIAFRPNGTPVTASSPARAGDVIYINVTGLGQTTPPLPTGIVVPQNATFTAGPLDARIGGYNTSVLSAVALPGTTGVFRVAVVVPQGIQPVSGNAPMLLQAGMVTSNVVAIPVQ